MSKLPSSRSRRKLRTPTEGANDRGCGAVAYSLGITLSMICAPLVWHLVFGSSYAPRIRPGRGLRPVPQDCFGPVPEYRMDDPPPRATAHPARLRWATQ